MVAYETEILAGPARYERTRWSLILAARTPGSPQYLESWNELLKLYWRPVYRTVRFRWNESVESAKDLTQSFFATAFEGDWVRQFQPERGRFRTFLKAALENFMRNERRDSSRLKRGAGAAPLNLDFADTAEVGASRDSADMFEREWRRSLLEHAAAEMQRELRPDVFAVFNAYFFDPARPTYRDVSVKTGVSESDVTNHLHLAKEKMRQIVRRLVRESAESELDFEDEMRALFGAR